MPGSAPPPAGVLRAFDIDAAPRRLAGGQGETWRAGRAALKPAGELAEAAWIADLFEALEGPSFRVPRPIRTRTGQACVDGWVAWEYLDAVPAGPNGGRWPETVAACEAFHAALAGVPCPAFIAEATHAWAVADRIAFGEAAYAPAPPFDALADRMRRLLKPIDLPSQLVHGDFTGNVLFADGRPPAVIDFSPYWRPVGFAVAVVIEDALSWADADPGILALGVHIPEFRQLFVRATLRRILELDQHTKMGRPRFAEHVVQYERTLAIIEAMG
jgi:uncharacterized protein (TIGR02569 family)